MTKKSFRELCELRLQIQTLGRIPVQEKRKPTFEEILMQSFAYAEMQYAHFKQANEVNVDKLSYLESGLYKLKPNSSFEKKVRKLHSLWEGPWRNGIKLIELIDMETTYHINENVRYKGNRIYILYNHARDIVEEFIRKENQASYNSEYAAKEIFDITNHILEKLPGLIWDLGMQINFDAEFETPIYIQRKNK